jgi:oxygen-independent coproporphyrinogen-3 oxidase
VAGIYIHIPFCKQKCHYCNFFSIASSKNKNLFSEAILEEIKLQRNYLNGESIETIYFGGGTPSLLSADEITRIADKLSDFHLIEEECEITLEANPDDLNDEKIAKLKKTPVNRLSIGIQSFFDDDLQYLNRIHSANEALNSVKNVIAAGFSNISIDLIYGIPTSTDYKWQSNLETFYSLNIPHLSAYALTVETKTALELLIRNKKTLTVNEEQITMQFNLTMEGMVSRGYVQYEISNFCRKPFFSKHNTGYWSGKKYLGLGPSAHSFNGESRQWNVSNLTQYLNGIANRIIPAETELLTEEQQYNEYILTSLRTMWGVDSTLIEKTFGQKYISHFQKSIKKFLLNKSVECIIGKYILTNKGKLFADGVATELFIE